MPRPSSPVYAKASTKCPYSTLENFHHIYDQNDQRYLKISDKNGYLVYSLIIQYNMRASPHVTSNNATTSKTHLQCQISIQNRSPDFRQIHGKTYVFISWNTIICLLWWAPFALANNQINLRDAKSRDLVGRGGLEPPTSRLSGVRSNHLSYRPQPCLFTLKVNANLVEPIGIEPMTSSLQS